MGCANECDQFTRKREKHEPENNTITRMDGICMNILRKMRTQGAAGSFDQKRMGIINSKLTPLPVVYCSPRLSEGGQSPRLSKLMHTAGEILTVCIFTSSLVFSLYMIHGLATGGVSW
jgi:hypothetical protein